MVDESNVLMANDTWEPSSLKFCTKLGCK